MRKNHDQLMPIRFGTMTSKASTECSPEQHSPWSGAYGSAPFGVGPQRDGIWRWGREVDRNGSTGGCNDGDSGGE